MLKMPHPPLSTYQAMTMGLKVKPTLLVPTRWKVNSRIRMAQLMPTTASASAIHRVGDPKPSPSRPVHISRVRVQPKADSNNGIRLFWARSKARLRQSTHCWRLSGCHQRSAATPESAGR